MRGNVKSLKVQNINGMESMDNLIKPNAEDEWLADDQGLMLPMGELYRN